MSPPRHQFRTPTTVLRRPDGALQLGLDAGSALVIPRAPDGVETALRALRRPVTSLELGSLAGPSAAWVGSAVDALARAGVVQTAPSPPSHPVDVVGDGVLAEAVVAACDGAGLRVRRSGPVRGRGPLLVCSETVEPDRALLGQVATLGRPHLLVRCEPERTVVGPFVDAPGSACTGCTDLVRRDLDGAWPHLLAQLCRTRHTPTALQAHWAAAVAVAQVAAWWAGHRPQATGATVELDAATGVVGSRRWPQHPDCPCALVAA